MLAGQPTVGFAIESDRVLAVGTALRALLEEVERFARSLTPHELAVLRLGLEASHLEESVVQGDWVRARAHAEKLAGLLEGMRS